VQEVSALDWLLAPDEDIQAEVRDESKTFRVNLGTPDVPRWTKWVLRSIPHATLKAAQKRGTGGNQNRRERRVGSQQEVDEYLVASIIVAEATVEPDLSEACRVKSVADPAQLLRHRFQNKAGVLLVLNEEVLALSGWDDQAVQEDQTAVAVKN
jgi:hypothetical protein